MLLDPSIPTSADTDDEPPAPEPRKRRRQPKPPLTRLEAVQADAWIRGILERNGIAFRPAQETALVVLATGVVHCLDETLARPIFSAQLHRRAAEMALTFDAFRQDRDLRTLRLVGLRPRQGKAAPGKLAQAIKTLARDYDRHVGRLVTAGIVTPILSVIHLRYDVALGLWDIHVHALWEVADDKIDAMWMGLGTKFSDKWMDGDRVEHPGAAVNYCAFWAIDHRKIRSWPEAAILELWKLPRVRLMRPAGPFRVARRALKGMVVRRDGDRVVVEERPDPGPRRKAAKRPAPAVEGARVVGIGRKRIAGERALCAVVKAPWGTLRSTGAAEPNPAPSRARDPLAYGEYRRNSPPADPEPPRPSPAPGSTVPVSPASPPRKPARKAPRGSVPALPPRKAWMLAAWPPGPRRRLTGPIARRLAQPMRKSPLPRIRGLASGIRPNPPPGAMSAPRPRSGRPPGSGDGPPSHQR